MSAALSAEFGLPARLVPWQAARSTTFGRCLLLAGLIHLGLLLWLGTTPDGTAPPGEGGYGRINVTLRGPLEDGAPSAPPPQAGLAPATGPARIGGAVRHAPLPEVEPGAARLGPVPSLPALPALPDLPSVPAARPSLAPVAPMATMAPAPPLSLPPAAEPLAELAPLPPLPLPPSPLPSVPAPPAAPPTPEPALPTLGPARLQRLTPSPAAPSIPSPEVLGPAVPTPAALPAVAAQALQELAPPPVLRQLAPAATPAVRAEPLPPIQALEPAPPAAAHPEAGLPSAPPLETLRPAAPQPADAGPRVGADVAVPSTAASAPRPLNLELGRLRGGELSRLSGPGALPVLPKPPETDKLGKDIEKAGRPDCRTAHAGSGLLAVVPLAIDAVRGTGCKW